MVDAACTCIALAAGDATDTLNAPAALKVSACMTETTLPSVETLAETPTSQKFTSFTAVMATAAVPLALHLAMVTLVRVAYRLSVPLRLLSSTMQPPATATTACVHETTDMRAQHCSKAHR